MIENTGKDRISWDNVERLKSVWPEGMVEYFFVQSPLFFDLVEVDKVYKAVGSPRTIEIFKEYNIEETIKAYGRDHPEARKYTIDIEISNQPSDNIWASF